MKNFKPDKHLQEIGRWPSRALPYPSRFPAWREVSGTASRAPGHPGEIMPFWIAYRLDRLKGGDLAVAGLPSRFKRPSTVLNTTLHPPHQHPDKNLASVILAIRKIASAHRVRHKIG